MYGVVKFIRAETYADPTRDLDAQAYVELVLENLSGDEPRRQSTANWPPIHVAIRRAELFLIETSTPTFKASLHFSPTRLNASCYEIHPLPRGKLETGRIVKVTPVKADETDYPLSMLTPFKERFAVVTVGSARPHPVNVWLVGLTNWVVAEVEEGDTSATSA